MKPSCWRRRSVLITSGPTREPLDPIRFMTNASTGRMGFALAKAARRLGAKVAVVSGPTALAVPAGIKLVPVVTARQMLRQVLARSRRSDVVIGAAAVSDWRFSEISKHKIKRSAAALRLTLTPNPDIIQSAARRRRPGQIFVGFALETRNIVENARAKLERKGLDLVVANGPKSLAGAGSKAVIVSRSGARALPPLSKDRLARAIFKEVEALF